MKVVEERGETSDVMRRVVMSERGWTTEEVGEWRVGSGVAVGVNGEVKEGVEVVLLLVVVGVVKDANGFGRAFLANGLMGATGVEGEGCGGREKEEEKTEEGGGDLCF